MDSDEKLAQWAALFIKAQNADAASAGAAAGSASAAAARYPGITEAASDLLRAVDAGGIPAFMTGKLRQIALDNGVEVTAESTPNELVDAIRRRVRDRGTT